MAVDPADQGFMRGRSPNDEEPRLLPYVLTLQFTST